MMRPWEEQEGNFLCIDLKSFYASVECVDRGLDPLKENLVVADASRTDKTICLAVSPGLKAYGIPGRARLFEVKQKLLEIRTMTGKEIPFLVAPPRMARYIQVSADIYEIYLKYIAPEDIHVYSVDEVFIDCTHYHSLYRMTTRELAEKMIREVFETTGITATAGIGTNLYLAKIAMDIVAKKSKPNAHGVRIAALNEESYRRLLWDHQPLTDFWQIGRGISKRLQSKGIRTMGDIARCSLGKQTEFYNEDLLFQQFGVNAELLIDHAWGVEPCTMADIKGYVPETNSLGIGQVLTRPYSCEEALIILKEMTEQLVLDLVDKGLVTDAVVLHVGYDKEGMTGEYRGAVVADPYGRAIPKAAHGTAALGDYTSSLKRIMPAVLVQFEKIVKRELMVRRVNIAAIRVQPEETVVPQLSLFGNIGTEEKERSLQRTVLGLQKRYGKSAVFKGRDLQEGATTLERNRQIGGHRA